MPAAANGMSMTVTVAEDKLDSMDAAQLKAINDALVEETVFLKKFIAEEDAIAVKKATDGMGTDEDRLIRVLCNRTKPQLDTLSAACVAKYGKTLARIVDSDVGGAFGKMITYALLDVDDYGAQVFHKAVEGVGTDESALIDLLNMRTNAELAAIRAKYEAQHSKSVVDTLNSEFGSFSKTIRKLFVSQFQGNKSESTAVDAAAAAQQAQRLHKAGVGRMGTDEDTFLEILVGQSRAQIQAIKDAYERASGMSLRKAIEKEFSGTAERALVALLQPSAAAYTAQALKEALDGVGTDSDRICRLLGGTDKRAMPAVCEAYLEAFGATLQETFKREALMTGDFRKAAAAWCDGNDPTGGLECPARPSDPKALAQRLLREREALRSEIAEADAVTLQRACAGAGTDDGALIRIACGRSKEHLRRVDRAYHRLFSKSLVDVIKSECSGNYEDLLVGAVLPYDDFDSIMVKRACDGVGTNEQILIELLAPRANARIRGMKLKYDARNDAPLIDRLNSELSGTFKKIIVQLLHAQRDEEGPADVARASAQARALLDAGVGQWGTDEGVFVSTFTRASRAQIQAIKAEYEKLAGHSLRSALERETSGDVEAVLVALLYEPTEYYARLLHKAFKGMGTDEAAVVRVLTSLDKREMKPVADHYLETYGRTLTEAIKSELSGDFERAALAWVRTPDPLDMTALSGALSALGPLTARAAPAIMTATKTVQLGAGDVGMLAGGLSDTVALGLGWETYGQGVDLDASVVMLSDDGAARHVVFFGAKSAPGVAYGGDDRTGEGGGDDETVVVRLRDVPADVDALVFTVHCYSADATFKCVQKAYARLYLPSSGHVCANFSIGGDIRTRGVAFAMLKRCPGGWVYICLGTGIPGGQAPAPESLQAIRDIYASTGVLVQGMALQP